MSPDQANGSVASSDRRDVSGEEAWALRCSLPAIATWLPLNVKPEANSPQGTSSMQLPTTLPEAEDGSILETQCQPQISETCSFLYSIPQWEPPSKQLQGQHPSNRPTQPVSTQPTRPPSARLQGLPPRSLDSIRRSESSSTRPQTLQPAVLAKQPGPDEKISGIYGKDVLDGTIAIRPRNKESKELRQLKVSRSSYGAQGDHLPRSMKIIIQQFMVANEFVCPYQHLLNSEKNAFRDSLLNRLDLHNTFRVTKETYDGKRLIKSAWSSIDGYISKKSSKWKFQGVFQQASGTARPTFATFTSGWTNRNWNGNTLDFARAAMLPMLPPVSPLSPHDLGRKSRPGGQENFREASQQVIVLDDNTEESLDITYVGTKSAMKRLPQDDQNTQASKRARTRNDSTVTNDPDHVDQNYDGRHGLDFAITGEKGLPQVIEAIRHARATMSELAPLSAKDLAMMQQDWTSDGFPSVLTEMLMIGRAYTATMNEYFKQALELLSADWEAGHTEVQVDCPCQKADAAPERLQDGVVPVADLLMSKFGIHMSEETRYQTEAKIVHSLTSPYLSSEIPKWTAQLSPKKAQHLTAA